MSSEDKSQIIEAVIEAFKNNPELLKPTAQNISKASDTVTGLINTVLTPIELLNFVVKEHKEKFMSSYHDKINKIPKEQKVEPRIEIIGPIIDNLKYKVTEETLREIYAKLLASASDSSCSKKPLLAFNFVLNQLSPREVEVLTYLFKKQHVPIVRLILRGNSGYSSLIDNVIDNHFNELDDETLATITSNLIRLGLVKTSYTEGLTRPNAYKYVESLSIFKQLEDDLKKIHKIEHPKLEFHKGVLEVTAFGNSLYEIIFE